MLCMVKQQTIPSTQLARLYLRHVAIPEWVGSGRSQKELAAKSKVPASAISHVKRSGEGMSMDTVERLVVALGRSLDDYMRDARAWWSGLSAEERESIHAGATVSEPETPASRIDDVLRPFELEFPAEYLAAKREELLTAGTELSPSAMVIKVVSDFPRWSSTRLGSGQRPAARRRKPVTRERPADLARPPKRAHKDR